MRSTFTFAVLSLGILSACATGDTATGIIPPEFHVRVLSVPEARPSRATGFGSVVEVDMLNKSSEPLTVERIQISSMGAGRYSIAPVTERFNRVVLPGRFDTFEIWAQVAVEDTLTGSEEPVFVRGVAELRSATGTFRRTFVERVNPSTIRPPSHKVHKSVSSVQVFESE